MVKIALVEDTDADALLTSQATKVFTLRLRATPRQKIS